jgi:hypothetical protein
LLHRGQGNTEGPLYVKPTSDEVLQRIGAPPLDERLRLLSELEKNREELGHAARPELLARVLSEFGLQRKIRSIEVRSKAKPQSR